MATPSKEMTAAMAKAMAQAIERDVERIFINGGGFAKGGSFIPNPVNCRCMQAPLKGSEFVTIPRRNVYDSAAWTGRPSKPKKSVTVTITNYETVYAPPVIEQPKPTRIERVKLWLMSLLTKN